MARLRGSSMSSLIRDGIDRMLEPSGWERTAALERARMVIGAFDSGRTDVSEHHDGYLAAAYRDEDIAE